MALTVGLTAAAGAGVLLAGGGGGSGGGGGGGGALRGRGVCVPTAAEWYAPILRVLEEEGVAFRESVRRE
jgi:hypothetical protein